MLGSFSFVDDMWRYYLVGGTSVSLPRVDTQSPIFPLNAFVRSVAFYNNVLPESVSRNTRLGEGLGDILFSLHVFTGLDFWKLSLTPEMTVGEVLQKLGVKWEDVSAQMTT